MGRVVRLLAIAIAGLNPRPSDSRSFKIYRQRELCPTQSSPLAGERQSPVPARISPNSNLPLWAKSSSMAADRFRWTNAISTRLSLEAAVREVTERVRQSLPTPPDLAVVTISSAYASEYSRLVPLLLEQLPCKELIGCGGGGIIGTDARKVACEVESAPALSLSAAWLPGVDVQTFHISAERLPDLDGPVDTWVDLIGVAPDRQPHFVLLADPFSAKINDLLAGLDFAYPQATKVGGLASAATMGTPSGLFYYSERQPRSPLYQTGTVGVALSGNIAVESIVAQGCRPIGPQLQIAEGDRNIILAATTGPERDPKPPLEILRETVDSLSEADRELAETSLFVGLAMDAFKLELNQGDFLIRNLMGVDPRSGAVAIGDRVRPGQRFQFHLRDADTSADDLELLLRNYARKSGQPEAAGALMFSCLGRGEGLYGKPNFDTQLFQNYLGRAVPVGGFFCNGEIGPVAGQTFLHGYTSVFGIFRPLST